jgi:KEOPS complex subunit Cgi121
LIKIIGARGRTRPIDEFISRINRLETKHSATIQFFRADRIFGREHLESAVEMALRAEERGTARSKTLGMEILLYAAAERQITLAIEKLGVGKDIDELAAVIVGQAPEDAVLDALGLERDDCLLEPRNKDFTAFGITDAELETVGEARLPEMILEMVALSELDRK